MRSAFPGTSNRSRVYSIFYRLLITCVCCSISILAFAGGPSDDNPAEVAARQLIVLFDLTNPKSPSAERIVQAVRNPEIDPSLHGILGRPKSANKLLENTSPTLQDDLKTKPWLPRAQLEQFVVLTYPTVPASQNAMDALLKDSRVLSVEVNRSIYPSVAPSDKYFSQDLAQPASENYQWGMQLLNMPAAWDKVRGTAYVSAIDYGVQCPPGTSPCVTHPDLAQNLRRHFSLNFLFNSATDSNIDEDPIHWLGVDYRGHGTHVAGIIAATPQYAQFDNGNSNSGVAGVCWTCSFVALKTTFYQDSLTAALTHAVDHGIQAVNMSFGDQYGSCEVSYYSAFCSAMRYARDRDVVLIGASGNQYTGNVQWPANSSDVIAVGGVKNGGSFWNTGYAEPGSNWGAEQVIVAPALDVVSTLYQGYDYNRDVHCGDSLGPDAGALDGYGPCTGTSMAAPHVTGIVGLLRSINPLLDRESIRRLITSNLTPCVGVDSEKCGQIEPGRSGGIPDAGRAATAALGGPSAVNRLTPLFSFFDSIGNDHFYSVVPQMGISATWGSLLPQPTSNSAIFLPIGSTITDYTQFPTPPCYSGPCLTYPTPLAMFSVLSTHVNPIPGAPELIPLYRYSWANSTRTSHVYSANKAEDWPSVGYKLDGIEGYIYPASQSQPSGTVKVCRKYDSNRDDYVLFPGGGSAGTDCSATSDGFTGGNYAGLGDWGDWIGWAYPVRRPQSVCKNMGTCSIIPILMLLLLDD